MRPSAPVAITGGLLLLPGEDTPQAGGLRCEGDRIVAVGPGVAACPGDLVIDATGRWVMPGLVDFGVFAIDRPAFHFGGITRAALMPDQSPPLDHPARIRFAALSGKPDFWVHPLAAATSDLAGQRLAELALMKDAGARAIGSGRGWIADSGVMLRICQYAAMLDLPVVVHGEDAGIARGAVASAGEMATRLGLPSAPVEAELLAIERDCILAGMAGARLHIRQVTTRAGLDAVRRAQARGVQVTAGITPAHFMLSEGAISGFRTFARLSPPLRPEEDRQACVDAIADGTITVIASGHDPRGPEDKRLPFTDAEPGMAGAETLLALSLALVRDGRASLARVLACLTEAPARLLGVDAGRLEAGCQADVAIVDPHRAWKVDSGRMAATAGNTPFQGLPTEGRVVTLLKGGRVVED